MSASLQNLITQANEVIIGKERQIRLSLACLLARGDLLIEDVPGVGKTTLAHLLARLLGLDFQRVQFTSDLLPADILGVSIFERDTGGFRFQPGPVFTSVLLADEINRAPPKSQSALLEAMEERQVSIEGETRPLPEPFFVIATQNPENQIGTYPLPESQLDRFLLRISLGYPDRAAEQALLRGEDRRELIRRLSPALAVDELLDLQAQVPKLHVSDALLEYLQALLDHSRHCGRYRSGLSPRAGLGLLRAAQAWALLDGRKAVLPEDLQALFPHVAGHRLRLLGDHGAPAGSGHAQALLEEVPVP